MSDSFETCIYRNGGRLDVVARLWVEAAEPSCGYYGCVQVEELRSARTGRTVRTDLTAAEEARIVAEYDACAREVW